MIYNEFIADKFFRHKPSGFECDEFNPNLIDWQKECVRWALFKGKSALFEGTGLGKTIQSLEWADKVQRHTNKPVLILAPLAVSKQTKREGEKFGYDVNICKDETEVKNMINITNYEKIHKFNLSVFSGVVLDESGILKNFTGKIRNSLIESFSRTPYKLCASATPSPNDYTELGGTSHFLNVMTRSEMLAMYFINDTKDTGNWRMKGHVEKNIFWEFISSFALMFTSPYDIGFDGSLFELPELIYHDHVVKFTGKYDGMFVEPAKTLIERNRARQESLVERCELAADMINKSTQNHIVWCNLNSESDLLRKLINDSVEVAGRHTEDHKENAMIDFQDNKIKCLVTKPSIAGHGMNWQSCCNMSFVGLSDSFEELYQSVRRCWRFGQKEKVNVNIITGEREGLVVENIKRKEKDMQNMLSGMVTHMKTIMQSELKQTTKNETEYTPMIGMKLPSFLRSEP
jgi:hypothetical protein